MVSLKYLQKLLFLLVMGFSISMVCACSDKDDDDEPVQASQTSEEAQTPTSLKYYVKYEIDVEYSSTNHDITFRCDYTPSPEGKTYFSRTVENGRTQHWEGVYGPFEKGDIVLFKYKSEIYLGYNRYSALGEHTARIYVQEGDEGTFAIKREGTGSSGTLEYVIGGGNYPAI